MPVDWDWEKHRQLWSIKRFSRVPLVAAASIPPFQVEVLRNLKHVRCPVLLSHGTDDWVIPFGASQWLKEELEQHGVQVSLAPIVGGTHGFLVIRDYYLEARAVMCSWLRMHAGSNHVDLGLYRVRYFLVQTEENSYLPMA